MEHQKLMTSTLFVKTSSNVVNLFLLFKLLKFAFVSDQYFINLIPGNLSKSLKSSKFLNLKIFKSISKIEVGGILNIFLKMVV